METTSLWCLPRESHFSKIGVNKERAIVRSMKKTPRQRFMAKVTITKKCWIWKGAKNKKGYGSFWYEKKLVKAHRWAFENLGGTKIPLGMQIDHTCRNTSCVRPSHLEVVTHKENTDRRTVLKTHCSRGHELAGDNIKVVTENYVQTRNGISKTYERTRRICLPCRTVNNSSAERTRRMMDQARRKSKNGGSGSSYSLGTQRHMEEKTHRPTQNRNSQQRTGKRTVRTVRVSKRA